MKQNRKQYFNANGHFHRTDGPAYILENGTHWWAIDSEFHRDNGPAIQVDKNENKKLKNQWYYKGRLIL